MTDFKMTDMEKGLFLKYANVDFNKIKNPQISSEMLKDFCNACLEKSTDYFVTAALKSIRKRIPPMGERLVIKGEKDE